ncbi:hypothetical protein I4F81_006283 [Pyropia yezoensis]|uniref:Uncharacterized protein n=1 Tax=Pyropia yezoensis TaxID=2788 RepID=A0ACC3C0R0_PYRYE|nr:hypothetical protein I4F81_006283 [Neopyropia yezoensis]
MNMDPAAPEATALATAADVRQPQPNDSEPDTEPVLLFAHEESGLCRNMEGGCSFTDKDNIPCAGHPVFLPPRGGRGAFIGCSSWEPGDPPTSKGGHMSRCNRPEVDPDLVKTWLEDGIEDVASSDTCSSISRKRFEELTCKRHGGESLASRGRGGAGAHRLVQSVVEDNPSASIRALQAATSDASGGGLASTSFVRKLRHSARSTAHPFGQDLLEVMDLYRRSGYRHESFLPWLNRAVILLRAMVIGKTTSMYEELFDYYF